MSVIDERIRSLQAVSSDPVKHLRYYRRSLADGRRMDIPAREVRDAGVLIPANAPLTAGLVRKLFVGMREEQKWRAVLYAPLSIRKTMDDGYKGEGTVVYPYWIPAVISRSGDLRPPDDEADIPWLIRGVLSPNEYTGREFPVLSTVEQVDSVGTTFDILRDEWASYLDGAQRYFKEQTGSDFETLKVDGWEVDGDEIAILSADLGGAADAILDCYDHYLSQSADKMPETMRVLLTPRLLEPETIDDPVSISLSSRHYGQMADLFPLSPSQRVSLGILEKTPKGGVCAVNGPPGTGKTTLIQSVAADLIVKAFLASSKPPVIVGVSANNKAITNILDSFASVSPEDTEENILNRRWLPDLDALGQYLAANGAEKLENARQAGYLVSNPGTQGADGYRDYCVAHSPEACEEYFLHNLNKQAGLTGEGTLAQAFSLMRDKVADICLGIDRCLSAVLNVRVSCARSELRDIPIASLASDVSTRLSALQKKREPIENLIQREHLEAHRPGFFARAIQRLRYGNPAFRLARVQSELLRLGVLFDGVESADVYSIGEEAWIARRELLDKELSLSKDWKSIADDYNRIRPYVSELPPSILCGTDEWIETIQGKLDRGARHEAFWWALHGFEAQWLLQRDDAKYGKLNQGRDQSLERLEQRSYISPVFVSTLHSLPRFFSFSKKNPEGAWLNEPLTESIDLLVVDEAGQVAPELAVPAFALSKRALVVGDDKQLEPIWSIPSSSIDYANAKMSALVSSYDQYRSFANSRRGCVNGNLMVLAQDACRYLYPASWDSAGSLLTEHRRCAPEIIEYCNRFIYKSLLDVKTKSETSRWPALGYCHVGGESRKVHGSQCNSIEARAIASWVQKNEDEITESRQVALADSLAIITPFRQQQSEILRALQEAGVNTKGLVVGTVHSLQGAEKRIVVFSPVYGRNHLSGSLFFNQSYNMLNVAVSRAKRHFFVFGNMAAFKGTETGTPSGDLAKLLFRNPGNEIPNQFVFEEPSISFFDQEPVKRVDTLKAHRGSLKKAFEIAQERVVIVSPFIANAALQADDIPSLVTAATARGVEVLVLTDDSLDLVDGQLKPQTKEGRLALEAAGAKLMILSGIHNKTVIIDRSVFIEGSFNWLSAVRDENSQYHRYETSLVVQAPYCERFILRAEQELGIAQKRK